MEEHVKNKSKVYFLLQGLNSWRLGQHQYMDEMTASKPALCLKQE